jgi:hypothetical protein
MLTSNIENKDFGLAGTGLQSIGIELKMPVLPTTAGSLTFMNQNIRRFHNWFQIPQNEALGPRTDL